MELKLNNGITSYWNCCKEYSKKFDKFEGDVIVSRERKK